MKIDAERLEAMLALESAGRPVPAGDKGFERVLAGQIGLSGQPAAAPDAAASPPLAGITALDPLLFESPLAERTSGDAGLSGIFARTDDLLAQWEQYGASLDAGQASPRLAWDMLRGMEDRLGLLRDELERLETGSEEMQAVVNELEVLAATEKFKLNRGDYQ
jgi:hypothetical protein